MLSELARNAARDAVQNRLNDVRSQIDAHANEYENQIQAFKAAFDTQVSHLSQEAQALEADLAELSEEVAG